MNEIRRRPDSAINFELYRERALQERYAYVKGALPFVSPKTMRRLSVFATVLVVATGAFWATILTASPSREAANPGFPMIELQAKAPLDVPVGTTDAH